MKSVLRVPEEKWQKTFDDWSQRVMNGANRGKRSSVKNYNKYGLTKIFIPVITESERNNNFLNKGIFY